MKEPVFCHAERVRQARDQLFEVFQLTDEEQQRGMFAALLVENAIILLSGTYGTGKTQFVQLVRKLMFSDGRGGYLYDYENCHQELTAFDVLYHLDLAELQKGREIVHPKDIVFARLKFLNEIQRANTGFFNALLPLLSEHVITYRDHLFEVPPFLCIMDRNPLDAGSSEMPEAFMDRIDYHFEIPAIHLEETVKLQALRRHEDGFHWESLDSLVDSPLTFDQLSMVWQDVRRVDIPERTTLLAGMIADAFRLCVNAERSTARLDFDLDCENCQFRGEVCAHLMKVPGQRPTNSLLRLAQAVAWLEGSAAVEEEHLKSALPWSLSHRLCIRPEELRKRPSEQVWVRETALGEILFPKLEQVWRKALTAYMNGDAGELTKCCENDLVIRELLDALQRRQGIPAVPPPEF